MRSRRSHIERSFSGKATALVKLYKGLSPLTAAYVDQSVGCWKLGRNHDRGTGNGAVGSCVPTPGMFALDKFDTRARMVERT